MVVSLFVTPESGILVHDSFPLSLQYELLIGVETPYYYFVAKVRWFLRLIFFRVRTYSISSYFVSK